MESSQHSNAQVEKQAANLRETNITRSPLRVESNEQNKLTNKVPVAAEPEQDHQEQSNNSLPLSVTRNKIMTAQYECYQKIMQDPIQHAEGMFCNRTWDGWLCWNYVAAGTESVQHCPDYFQDFDPSEKVTKICDQDGHWFRHPASNRTWTNYTRCNTNTHERLQPRSPIAGFESPSLSCQRITLHKNLFFSFVCNSVITIIHLTAVANNQPLVATDPVGCKVSQFLHLYLMGCNYFWMLCEGVYLHTLIVVAVFAEKQRLLWYHFLGWVSPSVPPARTWDALPAAGPPYGDTGTACSRPGPGQQRVHVRFPLIPACTHAVGRSLYYNDKCWISSDTHLLYIIHGPICAALLVNLFFLLNIVRVLITKLKVTHQAESHLYMKAVRATLILVPLLGIQFVLLPWRPEGRPVEEVYDYIMNILMHYQVQAILRRNWNQYKIQFGSSFAHSDALRSASYTVSTISDGTAYSHDFSSEHSNGKSIQDMENMVLKPEKLNDYILQ
ncbi:hypothetical protein QTO34_002494 [Cnephaeus nilssonii]|uniref:Calcitonin gene-related peptide type 1 receptor n=1 Tax=Cnephaeus nilssonii TaxID=3371016 RepID=A0AA40LKL8_CNENI|nr:hypothetical protein QTO34_002494 [Eptesicus nilssonii]